MIWGITITSSPIDLSNYDISNIEILVMLRSRHLGENKRKQWISVFVVVDDAKRCARNAADERGSKKSKIN